MCIIYYAIALRSLLSKIYSFLVDEMFIVILFFLSYFIYIYMIFFSPSTEPILIKLASMKSLRNVVDISF